MSIRIVWIVLLHLGGLGLAWYLQDRQQLESALWVLTVVLLLDVLLLLLDAWQGQRLLIWLRRQMPSPAPDLQGK